MTDRTRDELITQALRNLKVVGSEQDPETDDASVVGAKVDGLISELSARGIVTISNANSIEEEYFNPLAELLANECAMDFGYPKDAALRDDAEARLVTMANRGELASFKLRVDRSIPHRRPGLSLSRWTSGA